MNYEINVKKFWEENEKCLVPFSTDKPRVPMLFWLDDHFILEEMKIPSTLKFYNDSEYRRGVIQKFNELTEKNIGKKFYDDGPEAPKPVRFEVIMGAEYGLTEGGTPWLESSVNDIGDLKELVSRLEKLDVKKEAFPKNWSRQKEEYEKASGKKLKLGRSSRGPATIATSVLGTVNTCMFMMDEPEAMDDFFGFLGARLVEYNNLLIDDTNNEEARGYDIFDDNCFLFPPAQYERFCAPVLEKVYKEFAPGMYDKRYQHSDSDMGHLMGILNDIGVNAVNFGPNIKPEEIRAAMPRTVILGQTPPFVLRNGSPEEIIASVRNDIEKIGGDGGLVESPAGSVPGGTSFENLRIYMWAAETYGKY